MSIQRNIATKMRARMIKDGLTIMELSEELGIAKSSVEGYLQEKINLRKR